MSRAKRRRARARGLRAETLAAWWLRFKGYRILARGFRVPQGEIDLIARRGRVLAVVEVKRRDSLASASDAVSPRQRRRIEQAAAVFLQRRPALAHCQLRFDVFLLAPRHQPRHLVDAWRPSSLRWSEPGFAGEGPTA